MYLFLWIELILKLILAPLLTFTLKLATDDSRNVCEMRKTCETRETQGRARDNVKINYIRFAVRLFSRTIILSLIARENPFASYIITAFTTRRFAMRDTRNQHKKQNNPYTRVASHMFYTTYGCFINRL